MRIPLSLAVALCLPQSAFAVVLAGSNGGNNLLHAIGWQTFDNAGANNNSGINDSTPESNSTFNATTSTHYLTGGIGASSGSSLGRQGFGQTTSNTFLQGADFGSGLNIVDVPDSNVDGLSGTPGTRQNMQGATSSAWKFQTNGNQEFGDVSVTNVSVFTFRLQTVHYDARRGATNSPMNLDLIYLATGSNLVRSDNGVEIADNAIVEAISFGSPGAQNRSVGLAARFGTSVRLAPGDSAIFRFRWTSSNTDFAQSQIDNLAFSGTFQDQNNGFALMDPAAVPEPGVIILLALAGGCGVLRRKR